MLIGGCCTVVLKNSSIICFLYSPQLERQTIKLPTTSRQSSDVDLARILGRAEGLVGAKPQKVGACILDIPKSGRTKESKMAG